MPYAEPTSPTISPTKERFVLMPRRHSHGGSNDMQSAAAASSLPSLPRRSTSSAAAASGHRKTTLVNSPRHQHSAAAADALESMRSVQSLPRRSRSPPPGGSSLGIRVPAPPLLAHNSQSSDSSIAPVTPEDQNATLPFVPKFTPPPRPALLHSQHKSGHQRFSSTSSSPTEPPSPHSWSRPIGKMIRKKSGEILKPSLKNRSLSTPNLGRNSGDEEEADAAAAAAKARASRSTRDLGEHAKSVRFNDMGLESVVLFLRKQKPAAVSKTADTNEIPTETEDENDTDLSDYVQFRTRRNGSRAASGKSAAGNGGSEEQTEIRVASSSTVPRVRVDFGPGTQGLLDDEHVVLERFELVNTAPLTLRGTALARNVAFQKWVAVRFTLDNWQTTSEVVGHHVSHVPSGTTGDEGWDRFSFAIKLEDYRSKLEHRALELCVRYSIDGREWWDSNNGQNYQFTFGAEKVRKARTFVSAFHNQSFNHAHVAPGQRQTRHAQSLEAARNPRNWIFPRTGASSSLPVPPRTAPTHRSASPMLSPPPAQAYHAPSVPDVHAHLNLKKWCAPSPPLSPPKIISPQASISLAPMVLPLAPERDRPAIPMTLVHGRPATSWPPPVVKVEKIEVVEVEAEAEAENDVAKPEDIPVSPVRGESERDGEATPVARSPEVSVASAELPYESPGSMSESEEEKAPPRRSSVAADLHALGSSTVLMTPPSSNLSSPETPTTLLPPESPLNSTGDSSPLKSISSSRDEAGSGLQLDVAGSQGGRTLNAASYQEFLDKFCFFKSPPTVTTPLDDALSRMSLSPSYSPGYPYYTYSGSASPHGALTPTYDGSSLLARSTTPTPTTASDRTGTPRAPASPTVAVPGTPPSLAAA